MNLSYLQATQRRNPLGKIEAVNFEWKGDSPYTQVTRGLLDDLGYYDKSDKIEIGPYVLLKVEDKPWIDAVLYVRSDRFGALRVAFYKGTRLLDLIYRRLIITLAVWRLAEFHDATVPTWKDIKVSKRFAK